MRTTNFSVYSKNPVPNAPEFAKLNASSRRYRDEPEDESEISRSIRNRLYRTSGHDMTETESKSRMTTAQKQRHAREQVMNVLNDPAVQQKITAQIPDILSEWATQKIGMGTESWNLVYSKSLVTTQCEPNKNLFCIRVKLDSE